MRKNADCPYVGIASNHRFGNIDRLPLCQLRPEHHGRALVSAGRYAEALQQFQVAQKTDPTNPDGYYNLASTYHKLGVMQKDQTLINQSEALYHQCLDLSPNHIDCHRGLAVLLVESGRPDRAFALLKNWSTQNPNLADARVELSRLHQEFGETKTAERYLDEALAMDPSHYIAPGQLAVKCAKPPAI